MIFLSKKPAAGGGGTIGPLVNITGATDYTSAHTGITNGTGFTIAMRWLYDSSPSGFPTMFGFDFGLIGCNANGSLFQNWLGSFTSGAALGNSTPHCMVFSIDTTNGLPGGRWMSCYINGVDYMSDTTTQSSQTLTMTGGSEPIKIFNNGAGTGAGTLELDTNGVWFVDQAMDPAANYSNFFDGSDQFQALPTNGVVNGVTPTFWQNGNAAAWNSGSDNNSNSYTMNGTVT